MATSNKPAAIPYVELQKLVEKYQLPVNQIAKNIGLSLSGTRQVLSGKSRITVNIGLRLAKYFSKADDYWVNLQSKYDINEAKQDPELIAYLKNMKPANIPPKSAKTTAEAPPKRGRKPKEEPLPKEKKPRRSKAVM
jgi:addiction module HigA family antidote